MKIYFAGSIRAGNEDRELYLRIIEHLGKFGRVLTEHVSSSDPMVSGAENPDNKAVYDQDMAWLKESDVVVAVVSTPSLGVGYEIGKAEDLGKKILCLYRPQDGKRLSAMISGNPNLKVSEYRDLEECLDAVDDFFFENYFNEVI